MYDRPSAPEMIQAVQQHLEGAILPIARAHSHKVYFQTLVALNVLKIVERENHLHTGHLAAEWSRLNMLIESEERPNTTAALQERLQERNALLCDAIRAGEMDDKQALFEHLKATAIEQLEVANPRFLQILAAEKDN